MQQPVLIERVSNASLPGDLAKYNEVKTPDTLEDIEGGALRPGGAPNLYSKENIGLLAQYAAIGVVYGSLYGVMYPFLNNYLRMTGTETASASALLTIPWTWKMFIGIISDCYPIFGYRRRPYVIFGWVIASIACFLMAVIPIGDPKYADPALAFIPEANLTAEQLAMINYDASSSGVKYILLLVLANLGCVIAVTASDGILVDLAQREPENIRGTTQTMICVVQVLFQCLSTAMIGFGLNSADYGGDFAHSIGFNGVMGVCSFFALAIIPISWFCMTEAKYERQSARAYFHVLYDLVQQRVVYQIIAFRFFRNLFSWFSVTAAYPIQSLWAKVTPVNSSTATIVGYLVAAASYWATAKYGLGWSWRSMLAITQVTVIVIDSIPTFLTIWNGYRAQWFWLGGPIVEYLPNSIGIVVSSYAVVEIIEVGNEAAVYGLITTVSTLASPFSTVLTKNVDANFDIDYASLQLDNSYVRSQVTYAYLVAYAFNLFSLVFLFLLPRQKAETQELKRTGGKSKLLGNLTVVYLVFTFCWSLMTNMMTFSSKTSCLKVAGGSGC
ncbi:Transmembrane protein [Globisporangium polare]